MPAVDVQWIVDGKLGRTMGQDIKNVQPSAKAIIATSEEINYKVLKFGSEFEPYNELVDSLRTAFADFVSTLEDKKIVKLVDSYEGFYSEVIDNVCEKACSLLYEGSIFSDTLKEHLVATYPELDIAMFSKPATTSAKSGKKAKEAIDLEALDIDLSDI